MMVPREAAATVKRLARGFPMVAVVGPRQSGKTTLVRHAFAERPYVSLEDPDQREFATSDPRGFLARYPDGAVLDEAQRCPQLFSYLQGRVDQDGRMGLFILTGSHQFLLLEGVSQSLAGRVAVVVLLPFSLRELSAAGKVPATVEDLLFRGMYPPVHAREVDPRVWYANYVATYLERDVRLMLNVRDLDAFQRFVRLCAARTGQLLNLSALATDAGITHNTARAWLSVLQASYVVHLLAPHHASFGKRLIKAPKLYFLDPGLASWLLGIQEASQLQLHPYRGALFESWVVAELLKRRFNQALSPNLYFWRDRAGHEVDVVIDRGDRLVPVEVKSGRTVTPDYFAALEDWRRIAGPRAGRGWVVYAGDEPQQREAATVLPWHRLGDLEDGPPSVGFD